MTLIFKIFDLIRYQRHCHQRSESKRLIFLQNLCAVRHYHLAAINQGISAGLRSGPILGFPVVDVKVWLHWLEIGRGTSETMVSAATAQCLHQVR